MQFLITLGVSVWVRFQQSVPDGNIHIRALSVTMACSLHECRQNKSHFQISLLPNGNVLEISIQFKRCDANRTIGLGWRNIPTYIRCKKHIFYRLLDLLSILFLVTCIQELHFLKVIYEDHVTQVKKLSVDTYLFYIKYPWFALHIVYFLVTESAVVLKVVAPVTGCWFWSILDTDVSYTTSYNLETCLI